MSTDEKDKSKILPFNSKEATRAVDHTLPPMDGPLPYTFENGLTPERQFERFAHEVDDWFAAHFSLWSDEALRKKLRVARDDLLQRMRLHL